jgi:transposase
MKTASSKPHLEWIKMKVHFDLPALEVTLVDYVHEVEHVAQRLTRLETAISRAPLGICTVIQALQALCGVAEIGAVTMVADVDELSHFTVARQLMGYSGLVPSEHSSGGRRIQSRITKTGNAHLRRVLVEAAWAYQFRPWLGGYFFKRQTNLSPQVKEIAWKAQHRLHVHHQELLSKGKNKPQIVTAIGRELLGFIWAIGVLTANQHKTLAAGA